MTLGGRRYKVTAIRFDQRLLVDLSLCGGGFAFKVLVGIQSPIDTPVVVTTNFPFIFASSKMTTG